MECCCMNTPTANEQECQDLKKTLMHGPLSPVEGIHGLSPVGHCGTAELRLLDFWTNLWCGMVWYGMDGCLLK